jgi:excisionase family DNA binding protein
VPKVVQLLYDADELFVKATELRGMEHINRSPLSLSTSQAAHALGVSLGTIRRWSDMGYLQSYRTPGGQRRFSQDQIEQFLGSLAQQTPDSAAERKVS